MLKRRHDAANISTAVVLLDSSSLLPYLNSIHCTSQPHWGRTWKTSFRVVCVTPARFSGRTSRRRTLCRLDCLKINRISTLDPCRKFCPQIGGKCPRTALLTVPPPLFTPPKAWARALGSELHPRIAYARRYIQVAPVEQIRLDH